MIGVDEQTRIALTAMLADLRDFAESDDGTDKYPDHQYLTEDIEQRLAALLGVTDEAGLVDDQDEVDEP